MSPRTLCLAALLVMFAGASGMAGQGTPAQSPPAQPAPAQPAPADAAPSAPQQPPVTFRAEVNYVEVDARVLDAQGRFVTELTQKDFQVFEDGKPQQVTAFSLVNIPLARAERPLFASKPIEPDVQTNLGFDGRVYLIVLDDLHTNPLRTALVKAGARRFVERYVGANDIAAVVHVSGRGDAGQEFTSNQQLLLSAIDKFMGRKLRSAVLERIDEEQRTRDTRQQGDRINDPRDAERGFEARNALNTLKSLTEYLGNVRGRRKALVLFSEGIDYDINDPFANRDATTILDATRDAIATATRGNVAIYGIDPRGLTNVGSDVEIQSFPQDPTLDLGVSALNNELRLGQDSLRVLADETGGFASVNTNDMNGAFQRLVDDNSSYYMLGYYSTNDRRDGRFRKIEVRVNRPGLTVRARKGYVAARGRAPETKLSGPNDASPELREAMTSPLPMSTLPMAASAAVFKGPAPNGSVVVSTLIGARDLELTEKNGTFHNDLEVALMAVSQSGKTFSSDRNTINLLLKPDTVPRVRAGGFRVITAIDLPVGRY
jgi:VWFA-related protein